MYNYLCNNYTNSDIMFMTIPVLLLANLPVICFTLLDIYKIKKIDKYRILYNNKRNYPTKNEIIDGIKESTKGFFGVILPLSYCGLKLASLYNIYPYNMSCNIPSIYTYIFHILFILFVSDILFYFMHRLMHTTYLYNKFHKFHHTYKEPFALTNHYVDTSELILFFIPPMIPPLLLGTHITIMWLAIILINWNGILIHSGYDFTLFTITYNNKQYKFPCVKEHDYHHKYFNCNYGATFPFMDLIMNTHYNQKKNL